MTTTETRARWLAAVAVVCAAATWLVLRRVYSSLPPLPWTLTGTQLLVAIAEAVTGRSLRARIAGRDAVRKNGSIPPRGKALDPDAMVRTLALAKATAYAAAVVAGIAAGFLLYLAGSLARTLPHGDSLSAIGIFVAAVILAAAALYLERSCRLPDRFTDGAEAPSA